MKARFEALDGLRGAACLVVVVFHFLSAFVPRAVPDGAESFFWWADSPIAFLYNGNFSVSVFFVLSGFVLAHTSERYREHFTRDLFVRYLRLALPATASVLLAWALLTAYPLATHDLSMRAPSPYFQWTYQGTIPSAWRALVNGLIGEFYPGGSRFNGVLWTMRMELIGSFGVYFFFQFCPKDRRLLLGLLALAVLVLLRLNTAYVSFALGSLLYIQYARGKKLLAPLSLILFAIGLVIGSQAGFATAPWLDFLPNALKPGNRFALVQPMAAAMVVCGVLFTPAIWRLFSTRVLGFLGNISFPLYLIHQPLILTVVAACALRFSAIAGVRLLVLGIATIGLSVFTAYLFELAIDRPVLRINRRIRSIRTKHLRFLDSAVRDAQS